MPERVTAPIVTAVVLRRPFQPGVGTDDRAASHADFDFLIESREPVLGADVVSAIGEALGMTRRATVGRGCVDDPIGPGDLLVLHDDGSVVREQVECPRRDGGDESRGRVELAVIGGALSGSRFPLGNGRFILGRGHGVDVHIDDVTVSSLHATLDLNAAGEATIVDHSSVNGTFVNETPVMAVRTLFPGDVVRVGATEFEVRPLADDDRPIGLGSHGRVAFNRPPRHFDRTIEPQITPPKPPPPSLGRAPFRITAVIVPLVFAGIMVALTKQIIFAAFAAMSPVMMVANAISDRRSNRDRARRESARFRMELVALSAEVHAAAEIFRSNRNHVLPDLAETLRRAALPSRRLWERRCDHLDFLRVRVGRGDYRWSVPLAGDVPLGCAEIGEILDNYAYIPNTAIDIDLGSGAVLGLAGVRRSTLEFARSVVAQVVCHHGPSDVRIAIGLEEDRLADWDWLKWLPHLDGHAEAQTVAVGVDEIAALAKHFVSGMEGRGTTARTRHDHHTVVILDADASTMARLPALRSWVERTDRRCSILVLADAVDLLPSSCSIVVTLADGGEPVASITEPSSGRGTTGVLVNGVSAELATTTARHLSRYCDPEISTPGASLPRSVSLSSLLDLAVGESNEALAQELDRRWSAIPDGRAPAAPIGMTDAGPLVIDLGRDGPHGLIGGTTGAGKSELLRSIVVSLAMQASPQELTFVLIDYKGGSAFDECAKLPHVVGMVTDLDESLSARAVTCLEAELRHREEILRSAGASDRDSYARVGYPDGSLPRLVIVVDEFAALKNELPEFIDALVDVAQRGRSLGVHLLLATQRPAGVVSDLIRANTELKIGLRMQEPSDSTDVIGAPDAALLPRSRHGMALVRFGAEAPVAFQAAYTGFAASIEDRPVRVAGFQLHQRELSSPAIGEGGVIESELQVLVRCAIAAHELRGGVSPRRPWPDPLPETISLSSLRHSVGSADRTNDSGTGAVVSPIVGVIDDPANQCRRELRWELDRGNLFLIGARRSDTASALATIGVALAQNNAPEHVHLFAVKPQASPIDVLAELPHVGDIVTTSDRPRLLRLVRELSAELSRRSSGTSVPGIRPVIVVLIDSLGSLKMELDDPGLAMSPWDQMLRVLTDGPQVGIISAATVDRPSLVSGPIAALAEQRWLFQLTDRLDYSLFGLRGSDVGALATLRCVDAQTSLIAQLCSIDDDTDLIPSWPAMIVGGRPARIRVLPSAVDANELGATASVVQRPWTIPIGMSDETLGAAFVEAHVGEHLLVTGHSRSGRSTTLAAFAETMGRHAHVIVVAPPRSPLPQMVAADRLLRSDDVGQIHDLLAEVDGPVVVLIDDAELIDDPGGVLADLIAGEHHDLVIVAAVRPELLRTNYSHWSRQLRRSRLAILLRPNEIDAEFAGVAIPRRGLPTETGRGFLAQNGRLELIQFCRPRHAPLVDAA